MIVASGSKYVGMEILLISYFKDCILIVCLKDEHVSLNSLQSKIKPAENSTPETKNWSFFIFNKTTVSNCVD